MAALQPLVEGLPSSTLPSQSFAQVLRPPRSASRRVSKPHLLHSSTLTFEDAIAGSHKGFPSMAFDDNHVADLSNSFPWTLVGKFSKGFIKSDPKSGRPPVEDLEKYFQSLDLTSSFSIGLLDNRHLLIQLSSEADYLRLYSRTVWYVAKVIMRIFKWSPHFNVERESSLVPIWISLPRLPIIFFAKPALFRIASLLGTPLRLDAATTALNRPGVARLQVEIDLLKPRSHQLWIEMGSVGGLWQKIEYEQVPDYCTKCWHVGHAELDCNLGRKEGRRPAKDYRPAMPAPEAKKRSAVQLQHNASKVVAATESTSGEQCTAGGSPDGVQLVASGPQPNEVTLEAHSEVPVTTAFQTILAAIEPDSQPALPPGKPPAAHAPPLETVVEVAPSSDEDQAFVINEANRFSVLEGLDASAPLQALNPDVHEIQDSVATLQRHKDGGLALQLQSPSCHEHPKAELSQGFQAPAAAGVLLGSELTSEELVIMLPLPGSFSGATVGASEGVSSNLNVEAPSWYPGNSQGINVGLTRTLPPSFNDTEIPQYCVDVDEGSDEEVDTDRDSHQDFLDSQYIRDDLFLEKRKHRRNERHFRGRGRPLGSRNRTYFDAPHTMITRSRTLD